MQSPKLNFSPRGLYIGGRWVASAEDKSFASINPSNMDKLADVPSAGAVEVDAAVRAAKRAFTDWSRLPIKERARCLERLADRIEENADALALIDAVDSGNAIVGMRSDMTWTADWLRYCAGLVTEIKGETFSPGDRHLNFTRRQPFGVVAKINPFNHPFRFCAEKAAAPLAAGNTVVIKGSEQAPLSSFRLGELCEGMFPDGVINIIAGDGLVGAALVRHPDVHRIGFVGSVPTGRNIAQEAAAGLKRVSLELGGKNPIVIFPDADPKKAATTAIKGMNMNRQGQSCSSTSRVFVSALAQTQRSRTDRVAAPVRSCHRLHRVGEGRRRKTIDGRRQACRSVAFRRAVHHADGLRSCHAGDADRTRRDFRPSDVGYGVGRLRRHARKSKWRGVRVDRRDRHQRPR
jgi:betaine-aldehyde dehydrogenase